jgi:hypothetical protein
MTATIKNIPPTHLTGECWTLEVKDRAAVLTMQEDTGRPNIVRQEKIRYTDFPPGVISPKWRLNVTVGVLI